MKMKQLSKLESAIFLLGGVLMVVGAACFAFGFSHPQLVQVTSWGFLLGTILFSVMQAMQFYEGPSLVIHRLKRMQYVADIFFVLSGISMVDTVYAFFCAAYEDFGCSVNGKNFKFNNSARLKESEFGFTVQYFNSAG